MNILALVHRASPAMAVKPLLITLLLVALLPLASSDAAGPCSPQLSFSPASVQVLPGGTASVNVNAKNAGTGNCSNAYLSLYYPEGLSYLSSTPTSKAGGYFWPLKSIKSGQTQTISLKMNATGTVGSSLILEGVLNAGNQDVAASVPVTVVSSLSSPSPSVSPPPSPSPSPSPTLSPTPSASPQPTPSPSALPPSGSGATLCAPDQEKGMWIWNTPRGMSEAWRTKILDTMSINGFNKAYIDGTELWFLNTQPEPKRTTDLNAFTAGLKTFITAARAKNIGVDVTFGYKNWGEPDQRFKPLMIVDKVIDYNASVATQERVCGIQSDIEPYLMGTAYENNKGTVLLNYVTTMDLMVKKLIERGSSMSANIVIPHFYDPEQAWTPAILFNGKTQSAYEHLLDVLKQVQQTSIHIMAYRNFINGDNGILDIATPELRIATEKGTSTRIVIAQEVGCGLDPDWVSWCGSTKQELESALAILRSLFAAYPPFSGFAINYIDPYIDMPE